MQRNSLEGGIISCKIYFIFRLCKRNPDLINKYYSAGSNFGAQT